MRVKAVFGMLIWFALTACLISQDAAHGIALAPATVTFTLDFPQSIPDHYSIAVDADGHARYEGSSKMANDFEAETYHTVFEISAQNRDRIFDWAKEAQYFSGKVEAGNSKLAYTGTKVLSYQDNEKSNTARYNYSKLESVRQLTILFQGMGGTLEYGRRLTYYHQYQKLALDDELKRMQAQAKSNELSELQAVSPILREILEDVSVMNVVRARAQQLIQMGESGH